MLAGLAVAFSCTSALYIPTATLVTDPSTLSELQSGRKLYLQKCGSCHTLYLPKQYDNQQWAFWMDKMESKVAMDSVEKSKMLKYLIRDFTRDFRAEQSLNQVSF